MWEPPPVESEAERAERCEREAAERAAKPGAEVYVWGGKHPTGRSVAPDETDTRVWVVPDWSCGCGSRGTVYWVVPASARERVGGTGILFPEDNPAAPAIAEPVASGSGSVGEV